MAELANLLTKHQGSFKPIFPYSFEAEGMWIDLGDDNRELADIDPNSTEAWQRYIWQLMADSGKKFAAGGYKERRSRYAESELFRDKSEPRCIHMGIDIWDNPGTKLASPLDATVHSFRYNDKYLDYGPTIILKHELEGKTFHTLYGHLSMESLEGKKKGQEIAAGETFCELGDPSVNGSWPPHLHFQLIIDMQGYEGDYPAICIPSDIPAFELNCPDPNLILGYPLE